MSQHNTERQAWLGLLARADAHALDALWQSAGMAPTYDVLRAPEVGTSLVRGRAGATGAPFNLGEVTVTRCSVRAETGAVGHGYVQGRSKDKALQAALIDALMQGAEAASLEAAVLKPLRDAEAAARQARTQKAAATKVDFFTLMRGED
ncbi:MAG: phosphonate C-P lyase system protein PhnG [Rhodobacterales bacterium]|nr:MAG: phosphonate C-P lyase system protein PhnG [Rhodobacterales bacterium]